MSDDYIKAGNPETPQEELRALLKDSQPRVRRRLAENPNTPGDVLVSLAADEDPDVRCAVAEHEAVTREIQERLVADNNVQVRYAVSGQYTLPIDLLQQLASEDDNPYVRDHARRTLEGIFLEQALKEVGFVARPGETDKLGDLLSSSGVISQTQADELARIARERGIPLGHALVESRCISRTVVVAALKAQNNLREGSISHEEAIWSIKHVLGKI